MVTTQATDTCEYEQTADPTAVNFRIFYDSSDGASVGTIKAGIQQRDTSVGGSPVQSVSGLGAGAFYYTNDGGINFYVVTGPQLIDVSGGLNATEAQAVAHLVLAQ